MLDSSVESASILVYGSGYKLTFTVDPSAPPKSSAVFPGWAQYPPALELLVNQISPTLPSGKAAFVYRNRQERPSTRARSRM